jgi:hypothetical protein
MRSGISDEALENLLCDAVDMKPEGHQLSRGKTFLGLPSMSKVGG